MKIGFIGLGMMGIAMARNLAKAGHQVRAWNRSSKAGDIQDGVTIVGSPKEAFQADVVFTMLSDDAAIRDVLLSTHVLRDAKKESVGVIHVVTSTISVAFAAELRDAHATAGIGYLSAPVFGRPDVAAAGQLNIVAAGDPSALTTVQPLFDVLGKRTWVLGQDPKQANAAKIAGNMMIAMAIEAMAEAVVLTGDNGIPPAQFFELMLGTLFGGRVYENYSGKIVKRDFEPGFKMRLGLKDLRLAAEAGEKSGKKLPLLDAVRARMTAAVDSGMGEQDWSAMADYAERRDP